MKVHLAGRGYLEDIIAGQKNMRVFLVDYCRFNWVAKDMNLGAHFISFLKCFEELKELLINGKRDESRKMLDEIYNSRKDIVRF